MKIICSLIILYIYFFKIGWITSLDISSDNKYLVSGSEDNTFILYDLQRRKVLQVFDEIH